MVDIKEYNLPDNVECLAYESEEAWHELRKKGVGGSDAGAIIGISKYSSPLKLYKTKIGEYKEDQEDNVYIKKGKDLESLIFEKYVIPDMSKKGYKAIHPEHLFINNQFPWLRANCDGLGVKNTLLPDPSLNVIIEIKWVSEWAEANWNGDSYCGIPAGYYAQVQHYMLVTGARTAYLYAMFDKDWTVKTYEIPFNYSFASNLVAKTKEFYDNLQKRIPPAISATKDKEFLVEAVENATTVFKETEEMTELVGMYLSLKKDLNALEEEVSKIYDKIIEKHLLGEKPSDLFKVSVSKLSKAGFDSKSFAADYPEVYEKYKTVSEYVRATIRKK